MSQFERDRDVNQIVDSLVQDLNTFEGKAIVEQMILIHIHRAYTLGHRNGEASVSPEHYWWNLPNKKWMNQSENEYAAVLQELDAEDNLSTLVNMSMSYDGYSTAETDARYRQLEEEFNHGRGTGEVHQDFNTTIKNWTNNSEYSEGLSKIVSETGPMTEEDYAKYGRR